jgi:hemerythrin-like domain-containing protein
MAASKTMKRVAPKDAVALLKEDHIRVRKLLDQLAKTSEKAAGKRAQLLATIEEELKTHTRIEEDVFYPAFRDAAERSEDRKLYYEAVEEHHVVDLVLPELKGTDAESEQLAAKAKVLKDVVEHHAREEETEMFPRARKLMGREELERLGGELIKAKQALSAGVLDRLAGLVRL